MTQYVYVIASDTTNGKVHLSLLEEEIRSTSGDEIDPITVSLIGTQADSPYAISPKLYITFAGTLSNLEITKLNTVVMAHSGINLISETDYLGRYHWNNWDKNQIISRMKFTNMSLISSSGFLHGMIFSVNHDEVEINLEIDNITVMNFRLKELHEFNLKIDTDKWNVGTTAPFIGEYDSDSKIWRIQTPTPMFFHSKIRMKMKGINHNRKLLRGMSIWQEKQ